MSGARSELDHPPLAETWRFYRVGYVLIRRNDEILLVCNRWRWGGADLVWTLPGGRADEAESFEAAARRETFEETGRRVQIGELLYVTEVFVHDRREHFVSLVFAGTETGEAPAPIADAAVVEVRSVPIGTLADLLQFPTYREPLLAYLATPETAPRYYLFHIGR